LGYFIAVKRINVNKQIDMKLSLAVIFFFCITLLSCQNSSDESNRSADLSESTSFTGLTGDSIKLKKTASLNFKVKDIQQTTREVSNLAQKFGGMVFNHSLEYVETGRNELSVSTDSLMIITVTKPQADISLRVPSENLDEFMYSVTDLGYFTSSSNLRIDDQSLRYLENILKQKNRKETLAQPATQKDKFLNDRQRIDVEDAAIRQQIENRTIEADANFSSVNLILFQNPLVTKEVIANYVATDYHLPFSQRLSNGIKDGWQYFLSFLLVLTHLWMFILVGLAVFLSYKYLQQKRKLAGVSAKTR
jgi:hypothetical protein